MERHLAYHRETASACVAYAYCLQLAALQEWGGMSCGECGGVYEEREAVQRWPLDHIATPQLRIDVGDDPRARPPVIVHPTTAVTVCLADARFGALSLIRARRRAGCVTVPVVVIEQPECPLCHRYLRAERGRLQGYCPDCGEIWATQDGFESVLGGHSRRRTHHAEPCPYCGERPAIRRGGCRHCRLLLAGMETTPIPKRRRADLLRALLRGRSARAIQIEVGVSDRMTVMAIEILDALTKRVQLPLFGEEVA